MWLGTMKHSNSNILEFKSTKNPIKVLGTFLSYNQNKNIEENFLSRIRRMTTVVSRCFIFLESFKSAPVAKSKLFNFFLDFKAMLT